MPAADHAVHAAAPPAGLVPVLTLATFINHLNVIAWNPFLPFMATELGLSVAVLGQVPALMMLLSAAIGLVIGPLADHYGYRRMLLSCLLGVVAGSLATGLATTLPLLVTAALIGAVGRAGIMPLAQAIVAASFDADAPRRRAVSRTQSGGPLAAILGIPLLTTGAVFLQWRGAFFVLSALALITALILGRMLEQDSPDCRKIRPRNIAASYAPLVRHRPTVVLIVAAGLEQAGTWVMWTYYGAFYVRQHAFTTQQVGWVSLTAGLAVLLGQTAAGGWLGRHPHRLFVAGCIGSGPLIGVSLILPFAALPAIGLMALGWFMHGLVMVSTVVLLTGRSPAGRATSLTVYGAAMNLGITVGAALGGLALAKAGYPGVGLCTVVLPLGSAALASFNDLRPGEPSR
jgi:MFS transporter, DHA1 family, inner membrane transport protein